MEKHFWELMVEIDNKVIHPFWDFIDPENSGTFLDEVFCKFCQWANGGMDDCEDKI